jgi:hypothetical protein
MATGTTHWQPINRLVSPTAAGWFAGLAFLCAAAAPLPAADLGSAAFEYFSGHWDCAGHFAANGAADEGLSQHHRRCLQRHSLADVARLERR